MQTIYVFREDFTFLTKKCYNKISGVYSYSRTNTQYHNQKQCSIQKGFKVKILLL